MTKEFNLLLLIPFFCFFLSCSRDYYEDGLTIDDFTKHLKSDMSYGEITDKFGQPSKDIGSGIHIYVYQLTDSTEMWIGYTDRIHYAVQMDSSHQQIRKLI